MAVERRLLGENLTDSAQVWVFSLLLVHIQPILIFFLLELLEDNLVQLKFALEEGED